MLKDIKYRGLITLLLITIAFWQLNNSLPFVMDDALYAHIYPAHPIDNGNPHYLDVNAEIHSFGDVLESQWNHYFTKNGRGLTHVVVQSFCGILGKPTYNICATFMFALFCLLWGFICCPRIDKSKIILGAFVLPLVLFFLLIPEPTCLWNGIAYGVNYLWSSVWCLLFALIVMSRAEKKNPSWALCVIGSLVAMLAGWSHEGLVIPFGAVFLWYICKKKWNLTKEQWIMFSCFGIAAMLLIFAPSNFIRAGGMNEAEWAGGSLMLRLRAFTFARGMYAFVACGILLLCLNKQRFIDYVKDNQCWIFGWSMALAFIVLVGALNARSTFGLEFFSIILLCRLLGYFDWVRAKIKGIIYSSFVLLLLGGISVLYWQYQAAEQYDSINEYLEASNDQDALAVVEPVRIPFFINRYVCHYKFDEPWEDWEERVLRFQNQKNQVLIADSHNPQNTLLLEYLLDDEHKFSGNSPFYKIGNYLISQEELLSPQSMTWELGDYNSYDMLSFAKKCVSYIKKPTSNYLQLELPIRHLTFQGKDYWIVDMYPKQPRMIKTVNL